MGSGGAVHDQLACLVYFCLMGARGAGRKRGKPTGGGNPASSAPGTSSVWIWVIVLGLIGLTVAVFSSVGHYGFVDMDDGVYVSENPQVLAGLTLAGIHWAFTTFYAGYWTPLVWLSYMVEVQLFGVDPGAMHITNVIVHVANALLVFAAFYRMTKASGRSAFVAALFAIHPLHVESVAWITERKDVLSTLFWLLSIHAYISYLRKPVAIRYTTVTLCFVLGLMAKPMIVTLPLTLLLLDLWPLGRAPLWGSSGAAVAWWRLVREKIPLFVIAAISMAIAFVAQRDSGAVIQLSRLTLTGRVSNASVAYLRYIEKTVWPTALVALYPFGDHAAWLVAVSILALVVLTVFSVRLSRRWPYLAMGWIWFIVTLIPVIGVVQVGIQSIADRFTYVPLIGLFVVMAWGGADVARHWRLRSAGRWSLVAGRWSLVAGRWSLVAGRWCVDVGRGGPSAGDVLGGFDYVVATRRGRDAGQLSRA